MFKSYNIRLYPNKIQKQLIDQTIGNCRFIYNQMLNERISIYESLKNDKNKLLSKSKEYDTKIIIADKFYPSSKLCCTCGNKKDDLKLSDRVYICSVCGNKIDRDLNASINLKNLSQEFGDYKHRELINPREIIYNFSGRFDEVLTG